jgi:hypothetical protein
MNTQLKLGLFGAGLLAAFAAAAGVGGFVDPVAADSSSTRAGADHEAMGPDGATAPEGDASRGGVSAAPSEIPGGLMISQRGYTLALARDTAPAGPAVPVDFSVLGPDGAPVTAYERAHDKDLHLIAVRRDLTGFQHVHPRLRADGTWGTELSLVPGDWRVIADFTPQGQSDGLTLGADLAVSGAYTAQPMPEPVATAVVGDYTVSLSGRLTPGRETRLDLTVARNGRPVTDLEPYLAAYGHLVALRDGDLAYVHVHPEGAPGDGRTEPGPTITFHTTAPSPGSYRLFLDFQHDGVVRTAAFTVRADGTPTGTPAPATPAPATAQPGTPDPGHGGDGHGAGDH